MNNNKKKSFTTFLVYIALILCIINIILMLIIVIHSAKEADIGVPTIFTNNPPVEKAVEEKKDFYEAIIFLDFIMLITSICIRIPKKPKIANGNLDNLVSPLLAEAIIDGKVRIKRIYYDFNN